MIVFLRLKWGVFWGRWWRSIVGDYTVCVSRKFNKIWSKRRWKLLEKCIAMTLILASNISTEKKHWKNSSLSSISWKSLWRKRHRTRSQRDAYVASLMLIMIEFRKILILIFAYVSFSKIRLFLLQVIFNAYDLILVSTSSNKTLKSRYQNDGRNTHHRDILNNRNELTS